MSEDIFSNHAEIIKSYYLQLQLTLDWMRHPLQRGDQGAVFLHCAKLSQLICQITFLLERKPFPPDKWLFYYLNTTSFGLQIQPIIEHYLHVLNFGKRIKTGKNPILYPQYRNAANLIKKLKKAIKNTIGDHLWIHQWYNYV